MINNQKTTKPEIMTTIKWDATKKDVLLITEITKRAVKGCPTSINYLQLNMDITAVHCNDNPLRLEEFLNADEFNFWHDIYGIRKHIDRNNGKLQNCFLPRFNK